MQFIHDILSFNQILTVSLLGWFVAQVLKTIINFILLGKFQLERMWGDGGMPSAHSGLCYGHCNSTLRRMQLCNLCCSQRGGYHYDARCHGCPPRDR